MTRSLKRAMMAPAALRQLLKYRVRPIATATRKTTKPWSAFEEMSCPHRGPTYVAATWLTGTP